MTYDLTIGRCDVRDGRTQEVRSDGDRLMLAGTFEPDDTAVAVDQRDAFVQQLRGLAGNRDEVVVPLTSIKRPQLDGFYRVRSSDVEELRRVTHESGIVRWSADLERVTGGYGAPLFDLWAQADLLENAQGVVAATAHAHVPPNAVGGTSGGTSIESEDGPLTFATRSLPGSKGKETITFQTTPGDAYGGSTRIEQLLGGVWYPIVGRQIPALDLTSIRLNNGVLRVDFPTLGTMRLQRFKADGTGWSAVTHTFDTIRVAFGTPGDGTGESTGNFAIIRNSPERCIIQAYYDGGSGNAVDGAVTFEMTRGAQYVNTKASPPTGVGTAREWGVDSADAASSPVAYSLERTSADADGNKWLAASADVNLLDAPTAVLASEIDTRLAVGIFAGTETNSALRDLMFGAVAVHQVAVAR